MRDTCKAQGCKKRIPLLAVTDGDPWCSADCCREEHGVVTTTVTSVYAPAKKNGAFSTSSPLGSYNMPSEGALTRKQRERLSRDRRARAALDL